MNQLVICLVVGLHTCSFSAGICCGSLQSKYAVRFTFILFLIILFYNVQMVAFHVSSRASGQRSWKKHSSSSLELVLGVMKHFRLILFVCVLYDVDSTLVDSCGRLYTCRAHVIIMW